MSEFAVSLSTRAGVPVALPSGLRLTPTRWSAGTQGGWDTAEIEATGPETALHHLRGWLRYGVQIRGAGGLLWQGRVQEIALQLGSVNVTVSAEQMFNAVNVIYSYTGDDGGGETGETGWLLDDGSVSEFGRKDALHSAGGEMTKDAALALRATILEAHRRAGRPVVSTTGEGSEYTGTLHCTGAFADLDWRYYADTAGYEAHEETGGGRVLLGWSYAASTLGFVAAPHNRLFDMGGKLGALDDGDQVKVSGSGSNNEVKTVKGGVTGDPQTYSANTISFDPTDDINDAAGGLGFLRAREGIRVTGSPNNDGYYYLGDGTGSTHIEVTGNYGAQPIQSDSAGPTVTIQMGHSVEMATALVNEIPGAAVTLAALGQMTAQGFQVVNGPWLAGEVAVHVAKHGAPTDDLVVEIRADNAGLPGGVIASGALSNANVPAKTRGWRSAQMTTLVQLLNGTPYWVNVRRLGAADATNYFSLSLDTDATYARGSLRLWDGSTWQPRAEDAHMPFKVWSVLDTTAKIAEIVSAAGGTVTGVLALTAAGVRTRKGRDGRTTAGDEVRQLMEIGDSLGRRMVGFVREGGTLTLDFAPAAEAAPLLWCRDGTIRRPDGSDLPPGVLPVARWVQVEQLVAGDWQADAARFLVDSAEYDARSGQWTLRPLTARDPFDIGTQQG